MQNLTLYLASFSDQQNIAQYNAVFSICINSTSTKYGLPDMEYFENVVRLPEIETKRSFLSKHEFKLNFNILINRVIHRGGRVLDTVCQHSRDI